MGYENWKAGICKTHEEFWDDTLTPPKTVGILLRSTARGRMRWLGMTPSQRPNDQACIGSAFLLPGTGSLRLPGHALIILDATAWAHREIGWDQAQLSHP